MLLVDGRLVAAVEEERLTGIKFANGLLPRRAVSYCLGAAGLSIRDVDRVVFAGATYRGFRELLARFFRFHFGHAPPVELVDHHQAHAASTYYGAGWERALVVTMDNSGDGLSTTVRRGVAGRLELVEQIARPNSLGLFYSAVTQFLGFQKDSDEYKVMGMAAHGQPRYDLSHLLEITPEGYRFHHDFIRGVEPGEPSPTRQEPLFDEFPLDLPPRVPGAPITAEYFDVAASAQRQLERAVVQLVRHHAQREGLDHVCLAGGVALNCKVNQVVLQEPAVARLYVPPVASDAGLALGAAYLAAVAEGHTVGPLEHAYWGPQFTPGEIAAVLDRAGVDYRESSDPADAAASAIAEGQIVGWFQGRLEYGPRALGNRSILADPRRADMQDQINQRVKFREEFRPVAPAVLDERGADWFVDYDDSPYMTRTFAVAPPTTERAPSIVHVDGTARLQSVHRRTNPLFHELIEAYQRRTGLPLVINTSLNAYNDPMACEPFQALRTFYATGMDRLVLGPFVLEKRRRDRAT